MKIRNKLLLFILSTMFIVFSAMIYFSYSSSKKVLITQIMMNAVEMRDKYRLVLDTSLNGLADIAKDEALFIESLGPKLSEKDVSTYLKMFVEKEPGIYGSTISFVPGAFGNGGALFGPYYHWKDDGGKKELKYVNLADPSYDYPKWDWFKSPVESGKPRWSEPYIDVGGGDVAMLTYSNPIFRDGKVLGVSTVDISLPELTAEIERIKIGRTGFAFLIDKNGTFLTLRRDVKDLNKTIFDAAKDAGSEALASIGRDMVAGKTGIVSAMNPLIKKDTWFAYAPLSSTGWSLAIVAPKDELLEGLTTLHHKIVIIAAFGLLLMFVSVFAISSKISRPIGALAESARRITAGDFSTELHVGASNDEVGMLSRSFSEMRDYLSTTLGQLYEEREMLRVAFSQMEDGIAILDKNCSVLKSNRAAERLLGLPIECPMPDHLLRHFEGSIPEKSQCETRQCAFKLNRRTSGELGPLSLQCTISPVLDDKGTHKEYVFSVRDITEQESEERSKRNFLSLMSHKLFTPLTVLQGKLMLLKDGLLGRLEEKQLKQVNSMADQTSKLGDLIESLVNYVSLEESKFDTRREEMDIAKALDEAAEKSKTWFADKNPEVKVTVDPEAASFSFNKKLFDIMMRQLIENGLKFNMSTPAKVDVTCTKEGDWTAFSVTDNGVGIPGEYIDKIFDKFYQIEKYYTGNVEGVGLGLTYVKMIVTAFDGEIKVSSEPGKGSTFKVRFK